MWVVCRVGSVPCRRAVGRCARGARSRAPGPGTARARAAAPREPLAPAAAASRTGTRALAPGTHERTLIQHLLLPDCKKCASLILGVKFPTNLSL